MPSIAAHGRRRLHRVRYRDHDEIRAACTAYLRRRNSDARRHRSERGRSTRSSPSRPARGPTAACHTPTRAPTIHDAPLAGPRTRSRSGRERLLAIAALGGSGELPLARVLLEAIAMQPAAIVCALLFGGDRGACVFTGTLLGTLVVQQRFPDYALLPLAPGAPGWESAGTAWVAIVLTAAGVLITLSRDRQPALPTSNASDTSPWTV